MSIEAIKLLDDALATGTDQPVELPPLNENIVGSLEEFMKALAIRLGKPLIRQSFPGPDAHKLTVDEYACEIGKVEIMAALGLCEEVKSIDSHLPKVRFDAPFTALERESVGDDYPYDFSNPMDYSDLRDFYIRHNGVITEIEGDK